MRVIPLHGDGYSTLPGVLQGVVDQVLQHLAEQHAIGHQALGCGRYVKRQSAGRRHLSSLRADVGQHLGKRHDVRVRPQATGLELGDIQECIQQVPHRIQGRLLALNEIKAGGIGQLAAEGRVQ